MIKEQELMYLIGCIEYDKVDAIRTLIEEGTDINYFFSEKDQVKK